MIWMSKVGSWSSYYCTITWITIEIDQEWLDAINNERKKEQSGPISHEVFEIIMDKLEKEWFDLVGQPQFC